MLLAIDIGNTSINLGLFDGDKLRFTWRLTTRTDRSADEYGSLVCTLLERRTVPISEVTGAVLCSVVPPLASIFQEVCHKYLGTSPLVIGPGIRTGVRISVDAPREVGSDRVVNAVAAHHLYGEPVIVIDFGTATTFDVVSGDGDYLGGAIAPGITIASEALFERTAMLPRIELTSPGQAIGRNTISAMQSGIIFGYVGLVEGLIKRIKQELHDKPRVIATGGYAYPLVKEIPAIEAVNLDLSLIGLHLIWEMNKIEK